MSLYITGVSRNAANSKPARDVIKKTAAVTAPIQLKEKKCQLILKFVFLKFEIWRKKWGEKMQICYSCMCILFRFLFDQMFSVGKILEVLTEYYKNWQQVYLFLFFKKINSLCWDIETTMIIKKFNLFFSVLTATQALIWLNDIKEKISACGQECR